MRGCKELLTKDTLHLETPDVHSVCTDGVESNGSKQEEETEGCLLSVHNWECVLVEVEVERF